MPIKQHDTLASQRSSWPRDVQLRNDRAALIEVDEMEGILADVDTVATVDGMELRDAGRALWHCWLDPQCLRYCRAGARPGHHMSWQSHCGRSSSGAAAARPLCHHNPSSK
jgi:hypothetical protein